MARIQYHSVSRQSWRLLRRGEPLLRRSWAGQGLRGRSGPGGWKRLRRLRRRGCPTGWKEGPLPGKGGSPGLPIPIHMDAQGLGQETQGYQRPLCPRYTDQPCPYPIRQRLFHPVHPCGIRPQGQKDLSLSPDNRHLPVSGPPIYLGSQCFRHRPDRGQRPPLPQEGGHIGLHLRAVEGQSHLPHLCRIIPFFLLPEDVYPKQAHSLFQRREPSGPDRPHRQQKGTQQGRHFFSWFFHGSFLLFQNMSISAILPYQASQRQRFPRLFPVVISGPVRPFLLPNCIYLSPYSGRISPPFLLY